MSFIRWLQFDYDVCKHQHFVDIWTLLCFIVLDLFWRNFGFSNSQNCQRFMLSHPINLGLLRWISRRHFFIAKWWHPFWSTYILIDIRFNRQTFRSTCILIDIYFDWYKFWSTNILIDKRFYRPTYAQKS